MVLIFFVSVALLSVTPQLRMDRHATQNGFNNCGSVATQRGKVSASTEGSLQNAGRLLHLVKGRCKMQDAIFKMQKPSRRCGA
jgi:hypothetical protein